MSVPCSSRSRLPSIGSKHPNEAANGCASFLRVWLVVVKDGLCDWTPPISSPSSPSFFRLRVLMDPQLCSKSSGRIRNPRTSTMRCANDSGIESFMGWPQSELCFEREPIWPVGRKRNADQTTSMATMDTARHPARLIALRITSRLRSPLSFEVFFG